MIRTALALCALAFATSAAAQTTDRGLLRGSFGAERGGQDAFVQGADSDPLAQTDVVPEGRPAPPAADAALTAVDPFASSIGPVRPVLPVAPIGPVQPVTTGSIAQGADDGTPFAGDTLRDAPRGVRLGSFLLYPELILRAGATSNVAGAVDGDSGALVRFEPSLRLSSDWDRHSLETTLRGSFIGYPDAPSGSDDYDISGAADSTLRIDANEVTAVEVRGIYALSPESRSSAESAGGSDTIYKHGLGGSLAVTRDGGLLAVTLRGGLDGTLYTGTSDAEERNNLVTSGTLRLAYDSRATLSPFAEATLLGRFYEDDSARDAKGYELRSGFVVNAGPKLTGEVAVGWRSEDLEGAQYKNLQGYILDGDLTWSPSRLTTVRLAASTSFEASSLTGASGSLVHGGELSVAHSLTSDVAVAVSGGARYRSYQGIDLTELTYLGSATAAYAFSGTAALQAEYSYERVDSSLAGQDYDSHAIEAGFRFRR